MSEHADVSRKGGGTCRVSKEDQESRSERCADADRVRRLAGQRKEGVCGSMPTCPDRVQEAKRKEKEEEMKRMATSKPARSQGIEKDQLETTTQRAKKDQEPPDPNPKKKKDTRNQPRRITRPSHADDAPCAP